MLRVVKFVPFLGLLFLFMSNTLLSIHYFLFSNTLIGSMAVSLTTTQPRKLAVMWSKVLSLSISRYLIPGRPE